RGFPAPLLSTLPLPIPSPSLLESPCLARSPRSIFRRRGRHKSQSQTPTPERWAAHSFSRARSPARESCRFGSTARAFFSALSIALRRWTRQLSSPRHRRQHLRRPVLQQRDSTPRRSLPLRLHRLCF